MAAKKPPIATWRAKKGMKFRVQVRNLTKEGLFLEWGYQQDSRTRENAEKTASGIRSWGRGWEARVIELSPEEQAAPAKEHPPAKKEPRARPHKTVKPPVSTVEAPRPRPPHPLPDVPTDPERFDEAIHAFERRLPITRPEWDRIKRQEREFAFMVSGVSQADLVLDVWTAIERAMKEGTGLEEFKLATEEMLTREWGGADSARVETIFRTNLQTAYNQGRYEVFSAPAVKEARPYFRFDAIEDDRTDDECADLNGTVLEQDDAFWDNNVPPLHYNCRCMITALSKEEAEDEDGDKEAPDIDHADEGFGDRPETTGRDWEPDLSKYPDEIADDLRVRLK